MADIEVIGGKRRYDFGGTVTDAPGGGQLVAAKRSKNEVELYNDQQKSLLSVVSFCYFFLIPKSLLPLSLILNQFFKD